MTRSLRLGVTTPVVTMNPATSADWEQAASPEELVAVAEAADRLGYHHLTCSEHVAIPRERVARRGSAYWDPLATLSFLAARTRRIKLATHVLVLGYHHPARLVKQYSTLDRLADGRVVLGVGVGTLAEEFELLGADFDDRGARADAAIGEIRRRWGRSEVDGFVYEPTAPRNEVEIWVGGRTGLSLGRAVALGDGWVPFAMETEKMMAALSRYERPDGFEVILWAHGLDPSGQPHRTQQQLAEVAERGATIVNTRCEARSVAHWVEQAEALLDVAAGS
jgi:probable F420-dependent oxidoreductase